MPDLLLELFSEEIPARMQAQAARDLERMARERLAAAELAFGGIRSFAGPRRLTLAVEGLPLAQADRREERKGPRANAPEQALAGFLRATGLTLDQLVERGGVLFATLDRPGRPTAQILAETVEAIVRGFPWPKSMRWGAGTLRWVRPLKRILCVFDGAVVPFAVDGIASGDLTEGHRFMGEDHAPFAVRDFADYAEKLAARYVMLDPAERRARIAEGCRAACEARGLEWVRDEGLLDEVCGLVEWPAPILGDMDPAFLDLPAEVIATSMRVHQRYFAVRDPATGTLAPHFVVVANIEPADGGAAIAHGNARVLSARLADARFFWDADRAPSPDGGDNFGRWTEKLKGVTFHAKLRTLAERVERIAALAKEIAPLVGADPRLAEIAARLCKADLASGMVGEFPELQGIMGGYYVRHAGEAAARDAADLAAQALSPDGSEDPMAGVDAISPSPLTGEGRGEGEPPPSSSDDETAPNSLRQPQLTTLTPALSRQGRGGMLAGLTAAEVAQVADAVRDHYKPLGPSDSVPTAPVTVAVALADKLDTLVGFFAIDERPTGSKDPYALRRAALGVIRLLRVNRCRLALQHVLPAPLNRLQEDWRAGRITSETLDADWWSVSNSLLAFFADRLKIVLREEGERHDLVDAVFALGDDDLVRIVRRVDALSVFLGTEDGASLLGGYRRAANILRAEAKRTPDEDHALNWNLAALEAPEEQALSAALRTVQGQVDDALDAEDFAGAMRFLSHLRMPVDAFFDKVLVNAPEPAVRLNRLRLLSGVRDTANRVADFSLVAGA